MELEHDDNAPTRTVHIVLRGDIGSGLPGFSSSAIQSVPGDTHITVRVADPAQLYAILDRLQHLDTTLLSLRVDL